MGPSIIFDKSAIQSLGQRALYEVDRYFYVVVPPVLLHEVLADLSLDPSNLDASKAKVADVARKVLPVDSVVNVHYGWLCICDLLGGRVEMGRRPIVTGGQPIISKSGEKWMSIGVQPEDQAVLRWQQGEFNEADLAFATRWRATARSIDLEVLKQVLPKPPFKVSGLGELRHFVDATLAAPGYQVPLLDRLLTSLGCEQYLCDWVHSRWRNHGHKSIQTFAPYAFHCFRVHTLFYFGMSHGVVSTKRTNIIDVEYLCYAPFAHIFCSGDKLHMGLAPLILGPDQSLVTREEMQGALNHMVAAREAAPAAEPEQDSLIRNLWMKHFGRPPSQVRWTPLSEEESSKFVEKIRPMIEAAEEQARRQPPTPRFPL